MEKCITIKTDYMKTIDKRVTRLDLSKEIEKLGLVKRSPFYWIKHPASKVEQKGEWGVAFVNAITNIDPENKFAAWQPTELWEQLPNGTKLKKHKDMFECSIINYKGFATTQESNTEQDALAKALIFLLKNNLIPCKTQQKT